MRSVAITSIETELPRDVVDDAKLAAETGIEPAVVSRWSGGRERRESPDGEGPSALAARAAARLLAARSLDPADVDFIVFATNTPDMFFPGSGCLLQSALGCRPVGGLDLRSQCTGFLAALDAAWRFVATGMYGRVLVAAADTPSHFNARDGRTPHLTCAMSDAAAVALLEAGSGAGEILSIAVRTDGSRHKDYWCEYPASRFREGTTLPERNRLPLSKVEAGLHYPVADLDRLREVALERIPEVFSATLARAGAASVDATLVAHLDRRVEAELPARLGKPAGRILVSESLYAGGSTLPLMLARAKAAGDLESGQTVAMVTSGAGVSWGCGVVRVP
ncbi:MAG TPA: 3-oxoacyl-ACP synthase III family protein [Candidatus Limnocylindrales bacterium]|nr:3-oxoacyl-ACP synthase III family protein [Candidatus Limnocylindrales bacterium]